MELMLQDAVQYCLLRCNAALFDKIASPPFSSFIPFMPSIEKSPLNQCCYGSSSAGV